MEENIWRKFGSRWEKHELSCGTIHNGGSFSREADLEGPKFTYIRTEGLVDTKVDTVNGRPGVHLRVFNDFPATIEQHGRFED
jgi:hypothetical protein